jgi:membrane fusion protein (multidrug efflux system)
VINARAFIVLASAALSAACHKTQAPAPPPPAVQVTEVVQKDVPIYREWTGSLDGFVNAEIHPQVQGYVLKKAYREGTYVREGDLLFEIDSRQTRAALSQAKGVLASDAAALAKARLDVARYTQLRSQGAVAQKVLDDALAAEREAAAGSASARASVDQAALNRGWTQVISPIAGIAGIAKAQVGDLVNAQTVMTTVSQVDPIKVLFNISERDYLRYARAKQGRRELDQDPRLELVLDDGSVYPHSGTVLLTDRQVNLRTGTMAVEGSFPNPGNILRPGQYAKVRAGVETRKGALLVPQRAVRDLQGTYQVGVVGGDSKAEIRVVQPAEQIGSLWIIDKGLTAGDKVIVSDLARVRTGMQVRAMAASTNSGAAASPAASPGER